VLGSDRAVLGSDRAVLGSNWAKPGSNRAKRWPSGKPGGNRANRLGKTEPASPGDPISRSRPVTRPIRPFAPRWALPRGGAQRRRWHRKSILCKFRWGRHAVCPVSDRRKPAQNNDRRSRLSSGATSVRASKRRTPKVSEANRKKANRGQGQPEGQPGSEPELNPNQSQPLQHNKINNIPTKTPQNP